MSYNAKSDRTYEPQEAGYDEARQGSGQEGDEEAEEVQETEEAEVALLGGDRVSLHGKRMMSRIVKGQVCVTGEWHSFRVLMSLSDARQLVAEIKHDTARERAADAVAPEKNERAVMHMDDLSAAYERLVVKVKHRLGHPKKRVFPDRQATRPVYIEGQLSPADFRIEAIYKCK